MKKTIVLLSLAYFLSGCAVVGKAPKFPDYPEEIGVLCEELRLIEEKDNVKLSEVMKVVTYNYGQYHLCKAKVDSWIEWHKQQKKIFEEIGK